MLVAFGVLAFGVRIAIQLRRTGKTGLIGLREGAGAADWGSGILFIGGMAMGVASPVLVLNDALEPISALDVDALHVDLLSISGHKIYGPKGVGALYIRATQPERIRLEPTVHGGGQERDVRSGTLDVPSIVGLATAIRHSVQTMSETVIAVKS